MGWVISDRKTLSDVTVINNWPGKGKLGAYSWKAPSRIAYAQGNSSATDQWGFKVLPGTKSHTWMKLLLDKSDITLSDDPALARNRLEGVLRLPEGKTSVELCADYLYHVALFTMETLERRLSQRTLALTPLEFWFTVPAVWSDSARVDTLEAARIAARRAGIRAGSEVFVISEPEAAALAVFQELTQDESTFHVKVYLCAC